MPQDDAQHKGNSPKRENVGKHKTKSESRLIFISFHLRGVKMKSTRASLNMPVYVWAYMCVCVFEWVCVCVNPLSTIFDF